LYLENLYVLVNQKLLGGNGGADYANNGNLVSFQGFNSWDG